MLSIIVAIGRNCEIGAKNKLLWNIPEELKRFKEITTGHAIIMGRKTHESIGRILPNRTNIIISRDPNYSVEGAVVVHSLEEAIEYATSLRDHEVARQSSSNKQSLPKGKQDHHVAITSRDDKNKLFIIGGAQIFEQALPKADKLYITLVDQDFPEADTFFPEYETTFKKKVFEKSQESSGYRYKFLELEK